MLYLTSLISLLVTTLNSRHARRKALTEQTLAEDEYPICCLFERDAVSLTPETATYTSPKPQLGRGLFARQEVGASVSVSPTAH